MLWRPDLKKSFSVLTVSKRKGWSKDASICIELQPSRPDKWIIVQEDLKSVGMGDALLGYAGSVPTYFYKAPEKTKLSNLNASLNYGLRHIDADYVIFYQDFIELQEDCFEKLLALVDERTFVTTCTPNYDGSDDSRYTGAGVPRSCRPEEWEANVAVAPMGIIRKLGGFDERLDGGWAWDNVLLARKAAMLGARFIIDESNRPKLYRHEMSSHETLPKNGVLCERILKDIREGKEPLNCGCL